MHCVDILVSHISYPVAAPSVCVVCLFVSTNAFITLLPPSADQIAAATANAADENDNDNENENENDGDAADAATNEGDDATGRPSESDATTEEAVKEEEEKKAQSDSTDPKPAKKQKKHNNKPQQQQKVEEKNMRSVIFDR